MFLLTLSSPETSKLLSNKIHRPRSADSIIVLVIHIALFTAWASWWRCPAKKNVMYILGISNKILSTFLVKYLFDWMVVLNQYTEIYPYWLGDRGYQCASWSLIESIGVRTPPPIFVAVPFAVVPPWAGFCAPIRSVNPPS